MCMRFGIEPPEDLIAKESNARSRILQSALTLFATQGYDATPVDAIILHSSTSPSTLYRQFTSKEGLVDILYNILFEEYTHYFESPEQPDLPINLFFLDAIRRRLAYGIYRPLRHEFLREQDHSHYLSPENLLKNEKSVQHTHELIRLAQKQKHIRPGDPLVITSITRGAINHIMRLFNRGELELNEANFELVVKSSWDAIRY